MQANETNLEQTVENSNIRKIGQGIKNTVYAARQYIAIGAAAIAISTAAGCGSDESYCCEQHDCSGNNVCEDTETYNKTKTGVYCIQDESGQALECCECVYKEPKEPHYKDY